MKIYALTQIAAAAAAVAGLVPIPAVVFGSVVGVGFTAASWRRHSIRKMNDD